MTYTPNPPLKPFSEYIDKSDPSGCWPWTGRRRGGARNQYGAYGNEQAHRKSLEMAIGRKLTQDEIACHHCDNPICCNPKHLYAGTRIDNARDALERGQLKGRDQKGETNGNAKLTESDVNKIKARIAAGESNTRIARDYPVGHAMISKIRTGKFWRSRQDSNL